jgi:preprotein translocase subunit YajC
MGRSMPTWVIILALLVVAIAIGVFYFIASRPAPQSVSVKSMEEMKRRMQPPSPQNRPLPPK